MDCCDCNVLVHTQFLHLSTGHCHVSVRQFVPLSVHVYGSSRGSLVRCLLLGASASFPERSAPTTQVQSLLPPPDGTGQHSAHHRHALCGQRRYGAERRQHRPGQPRVCRHPGFHIGGDQSLVHNILRISLHVPKNLHGERRRQRASEHPAPGQWTRLKPGRATERIPLGLKKKNTPPASRFIVVMKVKSVDSDENINNRHSHRFTQAVKEKKTK